MNIDTIKMDSILQEVKDGSDYLNNIAQSVISDYTKDLTPIIDEIVELRQNDIISIDQLEDLLLRLEHILHFMGRKMESVGFREDMSKIIKQQVYNLAYLNNDVERINEDGKKIKPTKDANISFAEEESKYQNMIYIIYDKVYKMIKFEIDSGYEHLNSIKKMYNRRMQEYDIERYQNRR